MGKFTAAAAWLLGDVVSDGGKDAFVQSVKLTDSAGTAISFGTAGLPTSTGAKTGALSLSVVPNTDTPFKVAGVDADAAAPTVNPIAIAGLYTSGSLTTLSTGQLGRFNVDTYRNLRATTCGLSGTGTDGFANASLVYAQPDALGTRTLALAVAGGYALNAAGAWDRVRGDVNALAVQPALSANFWSYPAASGGILNTTTAVTVKTAAGASVRNYIESMTLDWEALGAATEVAIRDGAAGTVLWRTKIGTAAAGNRAISFRPPLKGTANTLVEVVTLTASVTGAVYANLQGWTGT